MVDPATITPGLVLRFEANRLALVGPQPGFTRKVRWSAVSGLRFRPSGVLPGGVAAVSLTAVVNGWAVRCWIRSLLYAGKPNWDLLVSVTPRWGEMPLRRPGGKRASPRRH